MKKVRTVEKELLLMAILYFVFQTAAIVLCYIGGVYDLEWIVISALCAFVNFVLYGSYKSHTKNIMKPIMGVSIALILVQYIGGTAGYIQYWNDYVEYYSDAPAAMATIYLILAMTVLILLIMVMHFVINTSHESSPKKIRFNQILFAAFALALLAYAIIGATALEEEILRGSFICGAVADAFMMGMIITVESNLDEFRIQREQK